MIYFICCILLFLLMGEVIYRVTSLAEVSRKVVHIGSCTTIALFSFFGLSYQQLFYVSIGFIVVLSMLRGSPILRGLHAVERESYGEIMLPLSVSVVSLIEPEQNYFVASYVVLGVADTLASLLGRRYGKSTYKVFGHRKSYIGSSAFLLCCMAILAILLEPEAGWEMRGVIILGLAAMLLTLVEAVSHRGTDNLSVPCASTGLLVWGSLLGAGVS